MTGDIESVLTAFPWVVAAGAGAAVATLLFLRTGLGESTRKGIRCFARSAGSLGRAVLPVVVSVAGIAAYATTFAAWWAQLVAGALLALLIAYVFLGERVAPERLQLQMAVAHAARTVSRAVARSASVTSGTMRRGRVPNASDEPASLLWAGALLGIALVVVGVLIARDPRPAVTLGVWMLVGGLVLRLTGYATSAARVGVVAVVVAILLRLAMFVGLIPFEVELFGLGGWLFWLSFGGLVTVLVVALAAEAVVLGGALAPVPGPRHRHARLMGLLLALVATAAIGIAMFFARLETTPGVKPVPGVRDADRHIALVDVGGGRDRRLAWTFAPVLRLHPDERFLPASAEDYLANSDRRPCGWKGSGCTVRACAACAEGSYSMNAQAHPQGVVFYARIVRGEELAPWPTDATPHLATLVQYWVFYDYDRWTTATALGGLVQEHDADWEFVAVGLDAGNQPIFLALSAHCGGQLVPWDSSLAVLPDRVAGDRVRILLPGEDGEVNGVARRQASHPIVAVALGSHANYADRGGQRPPDWGSCMHVPSKALGPLVYASNVRDNTAGADDDTKLIRAGDVRVVTARDSPMSAHETWGTETIEFRYRSWGNRKGPSSPPLQRASWDRAVRSFLCDRYWDRDPQFAGELFRAACRGG